jgi:hypothetical protein
MSRGVLAAPQSPIDRRLQIVAVMVIAMALT